MLRHVWGIATSAMFLFGATQAHAAVGTILLVVNNSLSLTTNETAKKTLMEGWGYTVTPISASSSQSTFDSSVRTSSVAYICESINAASLGSKLASAPIGVVTEHQGTASAFGLSSSTSSLSDSAINITNASAYITSVFATGNATIANSNQPIWKLTGTLGGFTTLGKDTLTSAPALAIVDWTGSLTSGTASARRVAIPWGTNFDMTQITANGRVLMQRSIEWCLLPVARWKLDDATGTLASDCIGTNNGTISGATWTTGKIRGGLLFNGSTDYVSIPDGVQFRPTTAMTIAGWVKASSWPTDPDWACIVLRKGDANPNNWELDVGLGRVSFVLDDYDAYAIRGNTVLATNTWYHVAATWDGATIRLYVNGVLDATPVSRTGAIGTDTRAVYLGGRVGSTDIISGSVDDVRLYSRALTAPEVAALMVPQCQVANWHDISP
jgi:hypothetical protein